MKIPVLHCENCGSGNLRRSKKRSSLSDLARMAIGIHPFRCLDCRHRTWSSIWLFSKLQYAKCPRCLRLDVRRWPKRHFHLGVWRKFLLALGAHTYRCAACRYNFISFYQCEEKAADTPDHLTEYNPRTLELEDTEKQPLVP